MYKAIVEVRLALAPCPFKFTCVKLSVRTMSELTSILLIGLWGRYCAVFSSSEKQKGLG
jgi:hypothetical protein